ncbi:MAG: Spy/CpxP family protein refolding chaperone [Ideonella sp.]|nr:MAG: Spy/CpxP family protein refolding chaperone [Burkholderiaceae bacterium]MBE7424593.1 Spy/CpxP family protein refolding chaperone [Ideonella sp.]
MKPWLKRTLIGLFGAGILFGGLAACSHRYHGHGWQAMSDEDAAKAKARMVERIGNKLDLDDAQKAKLGAVADQWRAQRQALRGATDPRSEIRSLVAGPTFDRVKAKAFVDGKAQAIEAGAPALIAAVGDFYDSLKPEQQQKVREFMARGRRGWGG